MGITNTDTDRIVSRNLFREARVIGRKCMESPSRVPAFNGFVALCGYVVSKNNERRKIR